MTTLATDNFNRADEAPIGSPWTTGGDTSTYNIVSNVITPSSLSDDASAFENTVSWPNDQYSQAVITVTGTGGGGQGPGVGTRMAAANYYRLVADHAATNNIELAKRVAGVYTQLWLRTQSFSNGATIYLESQGATHIAKLNGTAIGASHSDSSLSTGKPGVVYSSFTNLANLDNWEGGDFVVASTVPTRQSLFLQAVHRASRY